MTTKSHLNDIPVRYRNSLFEVAKNYGPKLLQKAASAAAKSFLDDRTREPSMNPSKPVKRPKGGGEPSVVTTAAPQARGGSIGPSGYKMTMASRSKADCDTTNGVTVAGHTMSSVYPFAPVISGGVVDRPGLARGALGGFSHTAVSFLDLDDRVAAMARVHLWYRFRRFRIWFQSARPTTAPGILGFGVTDQFHQSSSYSPTDMKDLMTFRTSCSTSVWNSCAAPTYVYDGAKVWSTKAAPDNVEPNEVFQLVMWGRVDTALTDGSLGRFIIDYQVDFYEPVSEQGPLTLRAVETLEHYLSKLSKEDREKILRKLYGLVDKIDKEEGDNADSSYETVNGNLGHGSSASASSSSGGTVYARLDPSLMGPAVLARR